MDSFHQRAEGVVILSIFDHRRSPQGHSDFRLAEAFRSRMPVLFVESIGFLGAGTLWGPSFWRRAARRIRDVAHIGRSERMGVDSRFLTPPFFLTRKGLVCQLEHRILAQRLRCEIRSMKLRPRLWLVTNPLFVPTLRLLGAHPVVYNRSDAHSAFPLGDQGVVEEHEHDLLSHAQLVVYANRSLFHEERSLVGARGLYVGHGVDHDLFDPSLDPDPDVLQFRGPRFGFFGSMRNHFLDWEAIAAVARACPHASIVMGGTVIDPPPTRSLPANVVFLPACPYERVGRRWAAVDVALLPYRSCYWIAHSNPVKLNEVLAMKKPLVALGIELPSSDGMRIPCSQRSEFVHAAALLISSRPSAETHPVPPGWSEIADRIEKEVAAKS